jgi:integrase
LTSQVNMRVVREGYMDATTNNVVGLSSGSPIAITYEILIKLHETQYAADMPAEQLRDYRSDFNGFLRSCNLTSSDVIGDEFGDSFQRKLAEHICASTANIRSHVSAYKDVWDVQRVNTQTPLELNTLYEAIHYYFDQAKSKDPKLTIKSLGIRDVLSHKHQFAMPNSRDRHEQLERILGAPLGAFTKFVLNKKVTAEADRTQKVVQIADDPFFLTEEEVELSSLGEELKGHCTFKCPRSIFDETDEDGGKWRIRDSTYYRKLTEWHIPYCTQNDGRQVASSAENFMANVLRFFGVLRKLKYDPAKFSLVWMCDAALVKVVHEYLCDRYGGCTNTNIVLFRECLALVRPKTGFVARNDYFNDRMHTPLPSAKSFLRWCKEQHQKLRSAYKRATKNKVKKSRDSNARIRKYLDMPHPIEALLTLIQNMEKAIAHGVYTMKKVDVLVLKRDLTLIKMLTEQPMRILMYGIMKYRPDGTGSLYKRESDGLWVIHFELEDFKNWAFLSQDKPYRIAFTEETSAAIDVYMEEVRPYFNEGDCSEFVFPGALSSHTQHSPNGSCNVEVLEKAIRARTRKYLHREFGPHAFRHLVATEIVKNDRGGLQIAADVLHDKLATVEKEYGHVQAQDGHSQFVEKLKLVRAPYMSDDNAKSKPAITNAKDAVQSLAKGLSVAYDKALEMIEQLINERKPPAKAA